MASFLCCRHRFKLHDHTDQNPPAQPEPRSSTRISRRQTIPKPAVSRKDIEKFYREGKELRRTEQEEQERANLRAALQEVYIQEQDQEEDLFLDLAEPAAPPNSSRSSKPATVDQEPLVLDGNVVGSEANEEFYLGPPTAGSSRFSFETTTDRAGVRSKDRRNSILAVSAKDSKGNTAAMSNEAGSNVPRSHDSLLSAGTTTSINLDVLEEFSAGGRQANTGQESVRVTPSTTPIQSPHLGDLELPKTDLGMKGFAYANSSAVEHSSSNIATSTPKKTQSKDSKSTPLENMPITNTDKRVATPEHNSKLATAPKNGNKREADHVTFMDETTPRQASHKESDITVTNIFSHIPSLLKPSVSTFSLETFVGYSTNSPRTMTPSPPPQMPSIPGSGPWFSYTESIGSFRDPSFASRPITPRLGHIQSSSSFYPSLADSIYSTDDPDVNSRVILERPSNDLSQSMYQQRFSGEYLHPGQNRSTAISSDAIQTTYGYPYHERPGTPRNIIGLLNFEKTLQTSDSFELNTPLERPNTVIPHTDNQTASSPATLSQTRTLADQGNYISQETLNVPNASSLSRSVSRGMDRPSTLRIVQTRADVEDDSFDESGPSGSQSKKLTRSRSQKFLKPLASGLTKMRERVGFSPAIRSSPSPTPTQENGSGDRQRSASYSAGQHLPPKERSRGKRLPITVANLGAAGESPNHRTSTKGSNSAYLTDPKKLGPYHDRKSSSLGYKSIASMPIHSMSRSSTLSSLYRTCRNTTYDDCVIYPFDKDGQDEQDVDQSIVSEGDRYDFFRSDTPYLELDEVVMQKGHEDDGGLLKELSNSSLNWRGVDTETERMNVSFGEEVRVKAGAE